MLPNFNQSFLKIFYAEKIPVLFSLNGYAFWYHVVCLHALCASEHNGSAGIRADDRHPA
jgi:hypothetical protein